MLRLLVIVFFIALLIVFSMSNPDQITIWIASFGWPVTTGNFILAVAIVALFIGLVLGAIGEIRQRHRARRVEGQNRSLEKQLIELHKRVDQLQTEAASSQSEMPSHSSSD